MSTQTLTAARLRELLTYDARRDIWRWKTGNTIAAPNSRGIQLDGRYYAKTTLARFHKSPDQTPVITRARHGDGGETAGRLIRFRHDTREADEHEPEPTPKPSKPSLKANPRAIAERLRALRVPEHAIARHLVGMRQAVEARQQIRRSNHTEQEEYDDGRA